jgi:molecular chaperone GrpE
MTEDAAESNSDPSEPAESAAPDGAGDGLEALKREAEESWAKYLRAVAELDNLRKRNARELENARKYGVERLAAAVLPVRDSIEAALGAGDTADVATLLEGERATLRLLDDALAGVGIEEIDPAGEPFDPTKHEAIGMLPSAELEPNSVLEVIQKGYGLHDRVLRPARVLVSREPGEGEA